MQYRRSAQLQVSKIGATGSPGAARLRLSLLALVAGIVAQVLVPFYSYFTT